MININTNRTFGIELEAYNISREHLIRELRNENIDAHASSYCGRDYSVWQIKTDSSINGNNGFEVVSPILTKDRIEEVKTVLRIINENGGEVNSSCGMHIHWGVSDWGIKQFRNFTKRYVKFEKAIDSIVPRSRRVNNNRYCKSIINDDYGNQLVDNINRTFKKIDKCRNVRQISRTVTFGKFSKLNTDVFPRSGTIEIRHHSGTLDESKILNWISLTGGMINDSDNRKAVKNFSNDIQIGMDTTDIKKQLSTLLNGLVRVGSITTNTRKFFKSRATQLRRVA